MEEDNKQSGVSDLTRECGIQSGERKESITKHLCKNCGDHFDSWKALYGHMRSCKICNTSIPIVDYSKEMKQAALGLKMISKDKTSLDFGLVQKVISTRNDFVEGYGEFDPGETNTDNVKNLKSNVQDVEDKDKRKVNDDQANTELRTSKIYKCKICSKVYGSKQALGGHVRSHNIRRFG